MKKDKTPLERFVETWLPSRGTIHVIEAGGYEDNRTRARFSLFPFIDTLMREAAELCSAHLSDLFYEWFLIENLLRNGCLTSETRLFGFRDCGVDNALDIHMRAQSPETYKNLEEIYSAVWRLDIEVDEFDRISFDLYRVDFPAEKKGAKKE